VTPEPTKPDGSVFTPNQEKSSHAYGPVSGFFARDSEHERCPMHNTAKQPACSVTTSGALRLGWGISVATPRDHAMRRGCHAPRRRAAQLRQSQPEPDLASRAVSTFMKCDAAERMNVFAASSKNNHGLSAVRAASVYSPNGKSE
jgi:hypothetical protein